LKDPEGKDTNDPKSYELKCTAEDEEIEAELGYEHNPCDYFELVPGKAGPGVPRFHDQFFQEFDQVLEREKQKLQKIAEETDGLPSEGLFELAFKTGSHALSGSSTQAGSRAGTGKTAARNGRFKTQGEGEVQGLDPADQREEVQHGHHQELLLPSAVPGAAQEENPRKSPEAGQLDLEVLSRQDESVQQVATDGEEVEVNDCQICCEALGPLVCSVDCCSTTVCLNCILEMVKSREELSEDPMGQ
jgi:hypothetical protein